MDVELEVMAAERAITRVVHEYCRGIDRLDLELVRRCYWPEATDDHGAYRGGVDGFVEFVRGALARFERTVHFIGNVLVDVELDRDVARAESYCIAFHRVTDGAGQQTDMTAGLRYVDRFERRAGEWRIARRVCAYDWRRTDPADGEGFAFGDGYVRGRRDGDDVLERIME